MYFREQSSIKQFVAGTPAAQVRTAPKADANSSAWYLSGRAMKISAADTLRERLVNALHRRYRSQVTSTELITAVYGPQAKHASHSSPVSRPLTRRNVDAGQLLRA